MHRDQEKLGWKFFSILFSILLNHSVLVRFESKKNQLVVLDFF